MPTKSREKLAPKPKYPWDAWFARKSTTKLFKGRDYFGMTHAFVIHARSMAKARGLKLTVKVLPDDLGIAMYVIRDEKKEK